MNKFQTALKEFARLFVFAIPGILIQIMTDNPALAGSYGAVLMMVLKSWDRSIHEDPTTTKTGILPF